MSLSPPFKWRHLTAEMILCAVRRSRRSAVRYQDVEERMRKRGGAVDHTTIVRWVQRQAPEVETRCRRRLKAPNAS